MGRPVKVTAAQARRYLEQHESRSPKPRKSRDPLGAWTHHHFPKGEICRRCLAVAQDLYGPISVGQCRACATRRGHFPIGTFFP